MSVADTPALLEEARRGQRRLCPADRGERRTDLGIVRRYYGREPTRRICTSSGAWDFLKAVRALARLRLPVLHLRRAQDCRGDPPLPPGRQGGEGEPGTEGRAGAIRSARERLSARLGREPTLSSWRRRPDWSRRRSPPPRRQTSQWPPSRWRRGRLHPGDVLGTEGMEEAIVEPEALRGAVAALPERERQQSSCCATSGYDPGSDRQGAGSLPGLPHRTQGRGAPAPQAE